MTLSRKSIQHRKPSNNGVPRHVKRNQLDFFGCEPGPRLGPIILNSEIQCGNVTFQYPFEIKDQHYPNGSWFRFICKKTTNGGSMPFLNINGMDLRILDFNFLSGNVVVNHTISYFNCRNSKNNGMSLNLTATPFYYSDFDNIIWSAGCGNLVTVFGNETSNFIGGCLQPSCRNGDEASSATGCPTKVPQGLTSFFVNMSGRVDSSDYSRRRSCGFASIVGSNVYYDLTSEAQGFDLSNWTYVPISLQWSTPITGACHLKQGLSTTCSRDREYCWQSLGSTHLCVCNKGYDIGDFSSTSIGTICLLLVIWLIYKVVKRRNAIMLRQKYFKKNGGLLLQLHLSTNKSNFEKVKLFTSNEMEKATDYYNDNRILGQGGQGTVYKGMLTDGSIVAIKKSKVVKGQKFDEKKVEQFINEVIILCQINHRNVVKLLGCCLEDEVPLLVFEFIPNGTLYDLIHHQNDEFPVTWEMRLRIAIDIANALFYLHSAASVPIFHRDIKSSNILLDDKYRAKVSDFGTSRSITLEQTHLTTRVQGTFGYMDPEYFRSSQFTEKSDVYSFGVVLVELLTGQKPISKQTEEVRSLVACFLLSMQESSLFDILDSIVQNDGPEKEITAVAKLAKRCSNLDGKRRPTMKQVAMELELIQASEEYNVIERSGDEESEVDEIIESWDDLPSSSTTRSIITDSVTLPLNASF
ncbi:putative wall-associated receptor kinase-like 11 [Hibiscus syriacus]|uniref:Wall-associated receptor kinase-like 11 n=1 Tax=Hibiscus syriacus TaxID=106335 RepID=A0A6A3D7I1_HIBSY|nr:putative wall-associated receptor kinase-like 11 [Hibiscus syriacus]